MKRRIIATAACALALAGCGGGGSSGISGTIADPALTTASTCHGNGTLQIILMNPNGATISRDMNAPIGDWRGGQCVIPFGFEDTPHLSGYEIKVSGLPGRLWVTADQAQHPIHATLAVAPMRLAG